MDRQEKLEDTEVIPGQKRNTGGQRKEYLDRIEILEDKEGNTWLEQ